jgi:hypothetical protein
MNISLFVAYLCATVVKYHKSVNKEKNPTAKKYFSAIGKYRSASSLERGGFVEGVQQKTEPEIRRIPDMAYSPNELRDKLLEMYPEINRYGLSMSLFFDNQKDAWVVTFKKGEHQRHAFLDRKDADACMNGNACIYLGVLISQYIKDLEQEMQAG